MKAVLMYLIVSASAHGVLAQALTAREIIKQADERMRGNSSYAELTMDIIRPEWKRSMSMKSWAKGTQYALVYIVSPIMTMVSLIPTPR